MRIEFCRLKNDSKAFFKLFSIMQLVCVKKAPLDHIFIIQSKKKKEKLFERKEICYVIVVGRF